MTESSMVTTLFEHQDFYLVYKPPGIGFHDEDEQLGFFNRCQQHFSESLFPVHRLDKLTSGLLLLARNKTAAVWFQQAFEGRQINKFYLALATSKPKKKQGSIIGDMVKARLSQWKLLKSKTNPAVSRFHSWGLGSELKGLRIFLVKPETGKTHQIRVALKSLGSPILGDTLYSGAEADRGYLHAFAIEFCYLGETISVNCLPQQGQWFTTNSENIEEKLQGWQTLTWSTKS